MNIQFLKLNYPFYFFNYKMEISVICKNILRDYNKKNRSQRQDIGIFFSSLLDFCHHYKDQKGIIFDRTTIVILKPFLDEIKNKIDHVLTKYGNCEAYLEEQIKFILECSYIGFFYFQDPESSFPDRMKKIIEDCVTKRLSY